MVCNEEKHRAGRFWRLLSAGILTGLLTTRPAAASAPVPLPAGAAQQETTIAIADRILVTGRLSLGLLNGDSHEYAYDTATGARISELTWSFDDIVMVGAGLSIAPRAWLRLNGDLWVKATDSSSLDDYDWLFEDLPWTHWSRHDDVDLTTGIMFDVNAELSFYQPQGTDFFAIVGFKRDNWAWDARGGSFVYSINGFRDTTGSFPAGVEVISYEQWFNVPYAGLGFAATLGDCSLFARFIGSPFVDAGAEDTHYLRNLRFENELSRGTMLAFDIAGTYHYSDSLGFLIGFHYQSYDEMKGSETVTDLTTGDRLELSGEAAGLDHSSALLSIGLRYTF